MKVSRDLIAAQRPGVQLRRARCTERLQKGTISREAVNCNALFGGSAVFIV
ncbi:MAG TPA: hypothetical protein VFD48_00590 [Pyrinomonadaceae bacterium]|nr:hypothetical protein [Pyrinomonadaceae bacterium]